MIRFTLLASVALMGLGGCATKATLKRFDEPPTIAAWSAPELLVTSAPADGNDPLTIKGLPERAAAAYIAATAAKTDASGFRPALAEPIAKSAKGAVERLKFSRVLVVSVQRPAVRPGDRYLMTKVEIVPAQPAFRFVGYQSAATEFTSVNIGTVTINSEMNAKAELAPTFGSDLVGTGLLSYGVKNTEGAVRNIGDRGQFSPIVTPEKITVLRTGAEGVDLTGQALMKLSVQLPEASGVVYHVAKVDILDDKGKPKSGGDATLSLTPTTLAAPQDLYVCSRVYYQDRVVTEGAEYLDEGRQTVSLSQNSGEPAWRPFLLVPKEELETRLWAIDTGNAALGVHDGLVVREIYFDDYSAAEAFVAWLKLHKANRIGGNLLSEGEIGQKPIPLANFATLRVERFALEAPTAGPRSVCPVAAS